MKTLLARHGLVLFLGAGLATVGVGSYSIYSQATFDPLREANSLFEAGEYRTAEATLKEALSKGRVSGREDEAKLLLARSVFEDARRSDTLTESILDEVAGGLMELSGGDAPELMDLGWQVVRAYASIRAHEKRLHVIDFLGDKFPGRPEVHKERARALSAIRPFDNEARAVEEVGVYAREAGTPEAALEAALERADFRRGAAEDCRRRAESGRRMGSSESYRADIREASRREESLCQEIDAQFAALPLDQTTGEGPDRLRLLQAESLVRSMEDHGRLARLAEVLSGEVSRGEESIEILEEARRTLGARAQAILEPVVSRGILPGEELVLAKRRFAGLLRRGGEFERAAQIYESLTEESSSPEEDSRRLFDSLLGRATLAIDVAQKDMDEANGRGQPASPGPGPWEKAESILERVEREIGPWPELLSRAGEVFEDLRDRRTECLLEGAELFARRAQARPHLGEKRQKEVESEIREFAGTYSRAAGELYWNAARLTEEHEIRLESSWRAAENFRKAGQLAAEIQALELFSLEADRDPRHTVALYSLGKAHEKRGFLERALQYHRANVDLYPFTPYSYQSRYAIGRIAEERGNLEEAIRLYSSIRNDKSSDFDPATRLWKDAVFRLAGLYERLAASGKVEGGLERAEELYRELLQRYSTDPRMRLVRLRMARIASEKGEFDEALSQLDLVSSLLTSQSEGIADAPGPWSWSPEGESEEDEEGARPQRVDSLPAMTAYVRADVLYRRALAAGAEERASALPGAQEAYRDAAFRYPGGVEEAWAYYQMAQISRLLLREEEGALYLERSKMLLSHLGETEVERDSNAVIDPEFWARILAWERGAVATEALEGPR